MQVMFHTDPNIDGHSPMAEHLQTVVKDALGRFGDRVTRVDAHLSDASGQSKASAADINCALEARLVGEESIIVQDRADNAHQAIAGAVRKLRRAVGAAIAKHDPRRRQARAGAEL